MTENKLIKDSIFLDTNILIYAYSTDEKIKKEIVGLILQKYETIFLSTQVINEFVNVIFRKKKLSDKELNALVSELYKYFTVTAITLATIQAAITIMIKHKYSYFDSLMIASALENQCKILFSEDMHHNHEFEKKMVISNPFIEH